ncbi:MAG TPA: ergothioneine biosynthesis protein EgtC [Acidimicrobiia bacterium]|jgi:glutamine amidotransferase|nr:ergothioneine biosynthesis protein EgtC [Acidimicrobiia bacterium]
MCRHLAYLGPPIRLGRLLVDEPHSLIEQARRPRLQTSGSANPDGFGVAWYSPDHPEPRRYRTATPIWNDPQLSELAEVEATAFVAAVRLASPGSPVDTTGNAPFVAERYAWSLNGVVDGWHAGVGDGLRGRVSRRRATGIEGVTDSETLFALALDVLDAGASPEDALATVVATVGARATGRLNVLLTDGRALAASAYGNSLFTLEGDQSVVVASEPLDDDQRWTPVPDRSLVGADAGGAAVRARL